jgi:hypothetical protein
VAFVPLLVFIAVYVPRVGHGFILDDYRWIFESRVSAPADLVALFTTNNGFYRPLVSLTFAINHALFGIEPFWYGLTNVALAVTCAALIYALARALGMPWGAAILAGSLWLLNFHGVNMAVLWISGRTALLLTAAAVAAAWSIVHTRMLLAALFTALALLSKEEAVALPAILGAWIYLLDADPAARRRRMWLWGGTSFALLAGYLTLRVQSGAMTPGTAPSYYRFTLDSASVARNVLEYADRALTTSVLVLIVAWIVLRPRGDSRERAPLTPRIIAAGAVWILGGYALTVFLPVRSSLYACFPSVGGCLIAATICQQWWTAANDRARVRALVAAIVLTVIAAPIHAARTHRLVSQADVSQRVWTELLSLTRDLPDGSTVVIQDDMSRRANIHSAFGSMLDIAYELKTSRRIHFWLEPHLDLPGEPPCKTCVARTLLLRDGELVAH